MFGDTVTVYNKYVLVGEEKWQRTVLTGVYWNDVSGAVLRKTGLASAASAVVVIPRAVKPGFLSPKAWEALTDKSENWTLQAGDTVMRGTGPVIIHSAAKELSEHDGVLNIVTVDDMSFGSGMDHWEVSAK